jgi:hypothetical protein
MTLQFFFLSKCIFVAAWTYLLSRCVAMIWEDIGLTHTHTHIHKHTQATGLFFQQAGWNVSSYFQLVSFIKLIALWWGWGCLLLCIPVLTVSIRRSSADFIEIWLCGPAPRARNYVAPGRINNIREILGFVYCSMENSQCLILHMYLRY